MLIFSIGVIASGFLGYQWGWIFRGRADADSLAKCDSLYQQANELNTRIEALESRTNGHK